VLEGNGTLQVEDEEVDLERARRCSSPPTPSTASPPTSA
jgi:hypothetical protein